MTVAATLALWRKQPFIWGQTDCITAVCNHVLAMTGIDPALPWRGMYSDEAGARAIYTPYGGPLALFRHGMGLACFPETDMPEPGAPVICEVLGHQVAGICVTVKRVAFMTERGCIEIPARVLGAWQI